MALSRGVKHKDFQGEYFSGKVIKGFGRGSKELGCPTANISITPYTQVLQQIPLGVYWGWASVNKGPVYGMALNVGWSPYYQNKEKTLEIHVLHAYEHDFYGDEIRAVALGYIRPEANFKGLEDLKLAIAEDIQFARSMLDSELALKYKDDLFLTWKTDDEPVIKKTKL